MYQYNQIIAILMKTLQNDSTSEGVTTSDYTATNKIPQAP